MQTNEETEIRFYLVGPYEVGKKSLRKRIQDLACTQTIFTQQPSSSPKRQSITQEDRIQIVQKYDLGLKSLFFRLFVIPEAEEINDNFDPKDDSDEEIAIEYKIVFKAAKKAIESYMTLPPFSSNNPEIKHVILFMHDLSNQSSFDQLKIYYKGLSKRFHFKEHNGYSIIFLGNKCEKKVVLDENHIKSNQEFLSTNSLTNFEVSVKLCFNFNDFFIKLLSHVLSVSDNNNEFPIEKLKLIIDEKQSFSKAPRNWLKIEESPGPGDYHYDMYRYNSKKEMVDCFVNPKTRFNTKIFANKIAFVFDKNRQGKSSRNAIKKKRRENSELYFKPIDMTKQFNLNPVGYSLSIKPGKLNLKKERVHKARERSAELRKSFEVNVTNLSYNDSLKKINNEEYFNTIQNRKREYHDSILSNRKNKEDANLKLQMSNNNLIKKDQTKKIDVLIKKSLVELDIDKMKEKYKEILYGNNSINLKKSENIIESRKKLNKKHQGPQMYDIRGSLLNPKKGFSIRGKPYVPMMQDNTTAQLVYLKTDFDVIAEKKTNKKASFCERFKSLEMIDYDDGKELQERFKKFEENRKESEKYKAYLDFQEYRRIVKLNHDYNYHELKSEKNERHKAILTKSYRVDITGKLIPYNDIIYNQVEQQNPVVSTIIIIHYLFPLL